MNAHHGSASATGSSYTYIVGYSLYGGHLHHLRYLIFLGGSNNNLQPNGTAIPTSIGFRTSSFSLKLKDPAVHPKTVVSTLLRVRKNQRAEFPWFRGSKSWRWIGWRDWIRWDGLKFSFGDLGGNEV